MAAKLGKVKMVLERGVSTVLEGGEIGARHCLVGKLGKVKMVRKRCLALFW